MRLYLLLFAFIEIFCVYYIDFDAVIADMVVRHNKYRKLHRLEELKYDKDLAEIALNHSIRMATEMGFFYSNSTYNGKTLGENFFFCDTFDGLPCLDQYDITFYWYKEYYNYCMSSNSFPNNSRNFITMMWKESTAMGCGIHYQRYWDCMDAYFVVCDFYPGPHPVFGASPEEIERNMQDRIGEDDIEKNPAPC